MCDRNCSVIIMFTPMFSSVTASALLTDVASVRTHIGLILMGAIFAQEQRALNIC